MFLGKDVATENEYITLREINIDASETITILGLELDTNLNFNKCMNPFVPRYQGK